MAITLNGTTGITTPALDADKIATTATGIDVTGTVVADGLTVVGGASIDGSHVSVTTKISSPLVNAAYISGTSNLYLRHIGGNNRIDSYNDPITATLPLALNALDYKFLVADSQKMTIDSSGNVGIGTTAPVAQSKLTVNGSLSVTASDGDFSSGGQRTILDMSAGKARIGGVGGGAAGTTLALMVGTGMEAVVVDATGRVTMPYQPFISAATASFDGSGYAVNFNSTSLTLNGSTYRHCNVGGNFNYSTGIFTAPITGDYMLIARCSNDTGGTERNIAHLWINGVFQGEFCESYGPYDNASNSSIFRFSANDNVRIGVNTGYPYSVCQLIVRLIG